MRVATAPEDDDELNEAQMRLVGIWKEKHLVSQRLLAYDTTSFYTWIAVPTSATGWRSVATVNRVATIFGRWD